MSDVDALANYIRTVDGSNTLGAGELAEKIVAWLAGPRQVAVGYPLTAAQTERELDAAHVVRRAAMTPDGDTAEDVLVELGYTNVACMLSDLEDCGFRVTYEGTKT